MDIPVPALLPDPEVNAVAEEQAAAREEQHHHVTPVAVYAATYLALMVLLAVTVGVYYIHIPWRLASNAAAMTVAVSKAVLVVLFFMGVRYSTKLTWVWAAAGFIWILILFGTLGDYITRQWLPVPGWTQ
jgi:cytochrome c oxidase subunit IV